MGCLSGDCGSSKGVVWRDDPRLCIDAKCRSRCVDIVWIPLRVSQGARFWTISVSHRNAIQIIFFCFIMIKKWMSSFYGNWKPLRKKIVKTWFWEEKKCHKTSHLNPHRELIFLMVGEEKKFNPEHYRLWFSLKKMICRGTHWHKNIENVDVWYERWQLWLFDCKHYGKRSTKITPFRLQDGVFGENGRMFQIRGPRLAGWVASRRLRREGKSSTKSWEEKCHLALLNCMVVWRTIVLLHLILEHESLGLRL